MTLDLKVPSKLVVTAFLSSGLTIVLSTTYTVLCILALVYRVNCDSGVVGSAGGSEFFIITMLRAYILKDECSTALHIEGLTSSYSVYVLTIITLCMSLLCLITGVAIAIVVKSKDAIDYLNLATYFHVGVFVASLVVDLTTATHFGMDHTTLKDRLDMFLPGAAVNYEHDAVRLAALLLMSVALKGYVAHAINLVLLGMLLVFLTQYQNKHKRNEHSIHKMGALNAFDQPKRLNEGWQNQPEVFMGYSRGPQVNNAYNHDEERTRTPVRENALYDYSSPQNRGYDRSDSWVQSTPIPNSNMGARPFSYLEEPKRPVPVKPPSTPSDPPHWRRDQWPQAPPVPAPDYSPQPRRLKSALKHGY